MLGDCTVCYWQTSMMPVPAGPVGVLHGPANGRQIEGGERVLIPALCGMSRQQRMLLAEDFHVSTAEVLQCRVAAPPRGAIR